MPQHLDFMETFAAVEVPPVTTYTDAIDGLNAQEAYFETIRQSLQLSKRALDHFFALEEKLLYPVEHEDAIRRGESGVMTDECLRIFRHTGQQAIASAMLLRDDLNYSVVQYAKFDIQPRLEAKIRDIQRYESR